MSKITREQALLEIEYCMLCSLEDIALDHFESGKISEAEYLKAYRARRRCKVRVHNGCARFCRWPLLTADQITRTLAGRM